MQLLHHTYELHHRPEVVCRFLELKQHEINPLSDLHVNIFPAIRPEETVYFVTASGPVPYVRWLEYLLYRYDLVCDQSEIVVEKEPLAA